MPLQTLIPEGNTPTKAGSQSLSENTTWQHRHVIQSSHLNRLDVDHVLKTARTFAEVLSRPIKKVPTLRGKVVVNMFYENSTRTLTSFELAGKYLSADVVNFSIATSSVNKGESIIDTAETLLAMGIDGIVIRHSSSGICQQLAQYFGNRLALLNAGDGFHDHPTQGLLDLYSIFQRMDSIEGKKITIVGDIAHSRVARSNIHFLKLYGADVHLVGPQTLMPHSIEAMGVTVHHEIEPALQDADIVMCLRLQKERQSSGLLPSIAEYVKFYGINRQRLTALCKPATLVMHPGPMNRNIEIDSDLADDPSRSIITNQVTSGVAIRMALLYLTLSTPIERGDALV